ncbi:MAG TPA: hypothetical protein VHX36_06605 [Candidatus Acidoferrales bacterium]|nr:hypothetical protein [Candidatus Acidoferrales bacterium]
MPFIRGRYHMNPTVGAALEAAREAEAALLALEQRAKENRGGSEVGSDDSDACGETGDGTQSPSGDGPVHRVEIEATEVVPPHSGRAARGFVTRVHRAATTPNGNASAGHGARTSPPETHVFSDHNDLMDFLGGELAKGQPKDSE